jgi:hypothetical protein
MNTAMDRSIADIDRAFSHSSEVVRFKRRIRAILREPDHPAVAARYGAWARWLLRCPLATAVTCVDNEWRIERQAFQVASALGRGARLSVEVLAELNLILRWLRFRRMDAEFVTMRDELAERAP